MGTGENPRRLIAWTIVAVAVAVVLVWVLYQIRDIVLLVYVCALFAIGFSPVVRLVERQRLLPIGTRRLPRWLAILVVYLAILGSLAGMAALVVPPLVRQAHEFATAAPKLVDDLQQELVKRRWLAEPITLEQAIQRAPGKPTDVVGTLLGAVWGLLGGLVGLFTILILTFYLLVEADVIFATFVRLFPLERRARVAAVSRQITLKVSAWLGGQLLLAAIIGASAAIGLGLLGVPYFYVLALIAAVGEMIPVVGPLLAAIPGIAVAWGVSAKLALGVTVFYVVQQQLENNLLVPKLMERQLGVSAATVIIALLVGSSLLGIVGALLAVPTVAILQVLAQELLLAEEPPGDPDASRTL